MEIVLPIITIMLILSGLCYLISMIYNVEKKRTYIGIPQRIFSIISFILLIVKLIIQILLEQSVFITVLSIVIFLDTLTLFSFITFLYKLEKSYREFDETRESDKLK